MDDEKFSFNKFIGVTLPAFLLGVISTLLALSLLTGCSEPTEPTFIKKVTVVKVVKYREPNTLQEYEVKWKVTLSDSHTVTLQRPPAIGDTITYRYYSK
jgi:hypothetical protein